MQKHPVRVTLIDELPVSLYEDGSVEIMDEHLACRSAYRASNSRRSLR
jgi:hypothetical protein